MYSNNLDLKYIDFINNLTYSSNTTSELFSSVNQIILEGLNLGNYSIFLLDDGDNNYYLENSTKQELEQLKDKQYPLFKNKPFRRLYGLGNLDGVKNNDSLNNFTIDKIKINISSAFPLYYNTRILGFAVFHDIEILDLEIISKINYLLKQLSNELVILKRSEYLNKTNSSLVQSLQTLKFLNELLREDNIKTILYKILNNIFNLLNAEAGCVAVRENEAWTSPVELGMNEHILNQLKYKDGGLVIDFAKTIMQPIYIEEKQVTEEMNLEDLKVNLKSLICIPIINNGGCDTIIVLANMSHKIDNEILLYIQKISEIATTAIQNYDIHSLEKSEIATQSEKLNDLRQGIIYTLEAILDEIEV